MANALTSGDVVKQIALQSAIKYVLLILLSAANMFADLMAVETKIIVCFGKIWHRRVAIRPKSSLAQS